MSEYEDLFKDVDLDEKDLGKLDDLDDDYDDPVLKQFMQQQKTNGQKGSQLNNQQQAQVQKQQQQQQQQKQGVNDIKQKIDEYEEYFKKIPDDPNLKQQKIDMEEIADEDPELQKYIKQMESQTKQSQIKNMQKQQQQQPQETAGKQQNQAGNLVQLMQELFRPEDCINYSVLKSNNEFLKKVMGGCKGQAQQVAKQLLDQNQDLFGQVQTNILNGKFKVEKYLSNQPKFLQALQNKLKLAGNNALYSGQIKSNIQLLQKEVQIISADKKQFLKLPSNGTNSASGSKQPVDSQSYMKKQLDNLSIQEKLLRVLTRLKEYENLAEYFFTNMKDLKISINETRILPNIQDMKSIVQNLSQSIDQNISDILLQQAPPITPEIFGQNRSAELLSKLNRLNSSYNQEKAHWRVMKNAGKKGNEQSIKSSESRLSQYMNDIEYLNSIKHNEWVPLPLFREEQIESKVRLTNPLIEKNTFTLKFIRFINSPSDKYKIEWNVALEIGLVSDKTDYCEKNCVFNYQKEKIFYQTDRKKSSHDLHTRKISLTVFQKGFFSDSTFGTAVIDLSPLEFQPTIQGVIDIQHKKVTYQLEYEVLVNAPMHGDTKKIDYLIIVKKYPAFNLQEGVQEFVKQNLKIQQSSQKSQSNDSQQSAQSSGSKSQAQQNSQNQKVESTQQVDELFVLEYNPKYSNEYQKLIEMNPPAGLTKENIIQPDCYKRSKCQTYLEQIQPLFEKKVIELSKENRREDKLKYQDLSDNFYRANKVLKKQLQSGQIDPNDYLQELKQIIELDKKILLFYQENNLKQFSKFMQVKLSIIQGELKMLEDSREQEQGGEQQPQQNQGQIQEQQNNQNSNKMEVENNNQQEQNINTELRYVELTENNEEVKIILGKGDFNGFSVIQLLDLDKIETRGFCTYYEKLEQILTNQYQLMVKQNNQSSKKHIEARNNTVYKAKKILEKKLNNQQISQEDYLNNLNKSVEEDQQLVQIYQKLGCQQFKEFVQARILIMKEELSQMQ